MLSLFKTKASCAAHHIVEAVVNRLVGAVWRHVEKDLAVGRQLLERVREAANPRAPCQTVGPSFNQLVNSLFSRPIIMHVSHSIFKPAHTHAEQVGLK